MSTDKTVDSKVYIDNLVLIANFIELGSRVIIKMAGNDISNVVDSSNLNDSIRGLLAADLSKRLTHYN